MNHFEKVLDGWLLQQIAQETNHRRREILQKGLGHGTTEFLQKIWFPAVGHFNGLYPEWEVRDYGNKYRYLDLAYLQGNVKGCIEIHGYRSHARDIEMWRFKDLCMKQAYLTMEGWHFLPIAYLSIVEEPEVCKHLALSFIGKFVSGALEHSLNLPESEALRFARGMMRPFSTDELATHLNQSERQTRRLLNKLVLDNYLAVVSDKQRYRRYQVVN